MDSRSNKQRAEPTTRKLLENLQPSFCLQNGEPLSMMIAANWRNCVTDTYPTLPENCRAKPNR